MAIPLCSSDGCIHNYLILHSPTYQEAQKLYNTTTDNRAKIKAFEILKYMINAKIVVGGVKVAAKFTDDYCTVCGYALYWKHGRLRKTRTEEV